MGIQLNGITGDAIIPGDVGIGGTLTYEDVANVDSIGAVSYTHLTLPTILLV